MVPLELEFTQIAVQVLDADLMVGAYNAALQQAPVAVNGVGVNVPVPTHVRRG